jgi:head-tail adaptor
VIGDYRNRFDLEAPLEEDDGAGGRRRSWQPAGQVWGAFEEDGERVRIVTRFDDRLRPGCRLRLFDRVFEVLKVRFADDEDETLAASCVELEG